MRKVPFAERLLSQGIGAERAAAIYGDLLQLTDNRGSFRFWVAYAGTVILLAWRATAALVAGIVAFTLFRAFMGFWIMQYPSNWKAGFHFLTKIPDTMIAYTTIPLWFLLPYAVLTYGVRSQFVRLAGLLTLFMTAAFLYIPILSMVALALAVAGLIAFVVSADFRISGILLILTVVSGASAYAACAYATQSSIWGIGMEYLIEQSPHLVYVSYVAAPLLTMIFTAFACSRMYKVLLRPRATGGARA